MNLLIRHALRIMICLTLAFNGVVQAQMRVPCPMGNTNSAQHQAMECCAEQMSIAEKFCKSGLECQANSIMVQVLSIKPPVNFAHQPPILAQNNFIASTSPDSVWRPPRA
ncbi:hypothetical protein [Pseudomonas sp. S9]|uniref:hypothetical protein n=1 Tax=Pseudomonas sp. S9 TaxID=686578 RepID=UPI0002556893|nr:hypothetical protein [Pseudomonas sp. S9]